MQHASLGFLHPCRRAAPAPLLGFNEPDRNDQAAMSVGQALDLWPQLVNTGGAASLAHICMYTRMRVCLDAGICWAAAAAAVAAVVTMAVDKCQGQHAQLQYRDCK